MKTFDPDGPQRNKIGVRRVTKVKFDDFSDRKRIPLVELADLAIESLMSLGPDEFNALVERRPRKGKPRAA